MTHHVKHPLDDGVSLLSDQFKSVCYIVLYQKLIIPLLQHVLREVQYNIVLHE
jgi:hypothetical protein